MRKIADVAFGAKSCFDCLTEASLRFILATCYILMVYAMHGHGQSLVCSQPPSKPVQISVFTNEDLIL